MNNDELNDKTLTENERHFADIEDPRPESIWNTEAANIAEDEMMDARDE